MTDADEDNFALGSINAGEVDLSDETQDFRLLNALNFSGTDNVKIPKRGEKDFEPHSTSLQSSTLSASREAMHNALSTPRIHKPRSHQIATYDPDTNMAHLETPKGSYIESMGFHKAGKLWLLPEEALHLLERGDVDIRWPIYETQSSDDDSSSVLAVTMSLQGAYAAFIGLENPTRRGLTLEMYAVYSALKRGGYTVTRASDWNEPQPKLDESSIMNQNRSVSLLDWFQRTFLAPSPPSENQLAHGPLVRPGLYRTHRDIFQMLTIIPNHNTTAAPTFVLPPSSPNPFRITYHLWKPSSAYKKRTPPPPDFRVCIVNARETPVPTLSQLNDLLSTTPYDPPQKDRPIEQSMKQGHRNVIIAVVDQGVTSYLKFSDAGFGQDPLFERKQKASRKRGGGRGRGRGRGG